eukprot:m.61801 g.61801  ORF g.61801 m.61801 type:complete len:451 (-) comp17612_c0_seq2:26-1378(-)
MDPVSAGSLMSSLPSLFSVAFLVIFGVVVVALYIVYSIKTGVENVAKAVWPAWWLSRPRKASVWLFRHGLQRDKVKAKKVQREKGVLLQKQHDDMVRGWIELAVAIIMDTVSVGLVFRIGVWFDPDSTFAMFVVSVITIAGLQIVRRELPRENGVISPLAGVISNIRTQLEVRSASPTGATPLISKEDIVTVFCPIEHGVQHAVVINMLSTINRPQLSKDVYRMLKKAGYNTYLKNCVDVMVAKCKTKYKVTKLKKSHQQLLIMDVVINVVQNMLKSFAATLEMDEDDISDTGAAAGTSFFIDLSGISKPGEKGAKGEIKVKDGLAAKLADSVMMLDEGGKQFVADFIFKIIQNVRLKKDGPTFVPLQFLFNMSGDRGLFLFYALCFEGGKAKIIPTSLASAWSLTHFSAGTLHRAAERGRLAFPSLSELQGSDGPAQAHGRGEQPRVVE